MSEINDLIKKWPKQVLKGEKIILEPEWKKGFVAFMCLEIVNAKFVRQLQVLSEQISEEFDIKFNKGEEMPIDERNLNYLKIMFRLKNAFRIFPLLFLDAMTNIDAIITPYKDIMDKELFLYYLGNRTTLQKSCEEQSRLAGEIDKSVASSFVKTSPRELEDIQEKTIVGIHIDQDIRNILNRISTSLDFEVLKV